MACTVICGSVACEVIVGGIKVKACAVQGTQNSATYSGPPGAWNIGRNDRCDLETDAVSEQKMALGAHMSIIEV